MEHWNTHKEVKISTTTLETILTNAEILLPDGPSLNPICPIERHTNMGP